MLSTHVEIVESIGRLSVALALGSVIGFERQWRQKMAGLRTNALVALGSCGFVVFSAMVGEGDPTRVAAQVVTGIGFLGAGIILREGINVHGLNTAATLWCSAMVGTFAGAGFWAPSLVATGFVVGTKAWKKRTCDRFCCMHFRKEGSACDASIVPIFQTLPMRRSARKWSRRNAMTLQWSKLWGD